MTTKTDGGDAPIQRVLARAHRAHTAGKLDEAAAGYREVLAREPEDARANFLLGTLLRGQGDAETGIALLRTAVAVDPNLVDAQHNLGNALRDTGDLSGALAAYEAAVARAPGRVETRLNMAKVLKALGRADEALRHLRKVLVHRPGMADAQYQLGQLQREQGDLDAALDAFHRAGENAPNSALVQSALGDVQRAKGAPTEAVPHYERAVALDPGNAQIWNLLGNARSEAGDKAGSFPAYREAIRLAPDMAVPQLNLGNAAREIGDTATALEAYDRAAEIDPNRWDAHFYRGTTLMVFNRAREALDALSTAVALKPDEAKAHNNLGNAHAELGDHQTAIECYAKAVELYPQFVWAHANLLKLLERTNQLDRAEAVAADAEDLDPSDFDIQVATARVLRRRKRYEEARDRLAPILAANPEKARDPFRSDAYFLLGELEDLLGDADAAFDAFQRGNAVAERSPRAEPYSKARYLDGIERMIARFTADWVASWRPHRADDDGIPDPVFLLGFPRSGTTLLDTMLRGHGDITVIEEKPIVEGLLPALEDGPGGFPQCLATLTRQDLYNLRRVYDERLTNHLETARPAVVIDKLPLQSIRAGAIYRMFPGAKFIFALRHPCDVVLSCFMQNFDPNNAMVNFYSIADAAHLYDRAMTAWTRYRALLPMDVFTVRYETMIEDMGGVARPLIDFLDLPWDERILDVQQTARARTSINTPSYRQVTEGLYTRARYRWERYAEHLAPVLPTLLPWARYWGYADPEWVSGDVALAGEAG